MTNTKQADDLTKGLNPEQAKAVLHDKGPLLILAGAGSGKTRVITHRIAHLVQNKGVNPYRILALTFTNKAAAEMRNRIESMIGEGVDSLWVGTFHSMMVRILRKHIHKLGFESTFIILDSDDQRRMIKECLDELGLDDKRYPARMVQSVISKAKNELKDPEEFAASISKSGKAENAIPKVYSLYQTKLKASSALDFDDILFYAVKLFREEEEILDYYRDKFEYILVDEYQDTNHAQYIIIALLAQKHLNLCVVGDDDQSIYSFRGANINNILDFEHDFKGCKVIKLEQNYRSTGNVLNAANSVIANNSSRKYKKLWTRTEDGDPITFVRSEDHTTEARYVANEIRRLVEFAGKCRYGDIAVLYRINALSRNFENELMHAGIPFKLYGGMRFYDRKEIRDIIAYMRLILAGDDISFARIVNVPKRGIGSVTIDQVTASARERGITFLEAAAESSDIPELARSAPKLISFYDMINRFRKVLDSDEFTLAEFIEYVQDGSGMIAEIKEQRRKEKREEFKDREETLREHLSAVIEFENQLNAQEAKKEFISTDEPLYADPQEPVVTLRDKLGVYLESIALYFNAESETENEDSVKLMTIHSAKGLEFDYVFLVGAEESVFPGTRSMYDEGEEGIEEERRLAYVSITRAKKKLYVTCTYRRMLFGQTRCNPVSRFIKEIPDEYIEEMSSSRSERRTAEAAPVKERSTIENIFKTEKKKKILPEGDWLGTSDIKVGDKVRHAKFGSGKIMKVIPAGNDAIVEIEFSEFPKKKMMLSQARLESEG